MSFFITKIRLKAINYHSIWKLYTERPICNLILLFNSISLSSLTKVPNLEPVSYK